MIQSDMAVSVASAALAGVGTGIRTEKSAVLTDLGSPSQHSLEEMTTTSSVVQSTEPQAKMRRGLAGAVR